MAKEKINFEDEQVRSNYRHTTSHILAQAVKKLWPDAKLAIGPSIENGFYYDFDMEHKLNIVLFEPTGRRLRPTARGAQVLHRASKVLEGVDDIRRICGDGGLSGAAGASRLRVAVASSPLRGSVMLERDFRGFRRRCPHIALDVSFLSSGSCLSELESGAVDAAVVAGRPGAERLVSERVGTVELRLLVSRGHAFASRKSLALADLEGALLAEPYDSSFLKATVLELLSRHGVRPRMAPLEMSAARHHGFLHEDGGAVLVVCDGRYPEQFPDVEAVPFAEGEGMELPAHLAWRQEADAARMGALAECLRGSR